MKGFVSSSVGPSPRLRGEGSRLQADVLVYHSSHRLFEISLR
jgi:hypothetical protein